MAAPRDPPPRRGADRGQPDEHDEADHPRGGRGATVAGRPERGRPERAAGAAQGEQAQRPRIDGPQARERGPAEKTRPQPRIVADLAAARGVERAEALAQREARGEEGGEAGGKQQQLERPAPRLGEERGRGQLEQPLERDAAQEEIGRLEHA